MSKSLPFQNLMSALLFVAIPVLMCLAYIYSHQYLGVFCLGVAGIASATIGIRSLRHINKSNVGANGLAVLLGFIVAVLCFFVTYLMTGGVQYYNGVVASVAQIENYVKSLPHTSQECSASYSTYLGGDSYTVDYLTGTRNQQVLDMRNALVSQGYSILEIDSSESDPVNVSEPSRIKRMQSGFITAGGSGRTIYVNIVQGRAKGSKLMHSCWYQRRSNIFSNQTQYEITSAYDNPGWTF